MLGCRQGREVERRGRQSVSPASLCPTGMEERERQELLLPETREVLARAERLAGLPVVLVPDPSLGEIAQARLILARRGEPFQIRFNPEDVGARDHLIAHECGHIWRIWSAPENERMAPALDERGRRRARRRMSAELALLEEAGIPRPGVDELFQMWHQGIVLQLWNAPQDLRIEEWLYREYPGLRASQERSLSRILDLCVQLFVHPERALTPQRVFHASNAMNAATAVQFARLFGDNSFADFYRGVGLREEGAELCSEVLDAPDTGYAGDRETTERWAKRFGLKEWFRWVRFARRSA